MKALFEVGRAWAFGAVALVGCGSSSSGRATGAPSAVYCSDATEGSPATCAGYTSLDAQQASDVSNACTTGGGTVSSSCPTSNLVGCCSGTAEGYQEELCFYCGSASGYQEMCSQLASDAKWTAGSGGPATCPGADGGTPPATDASGD